MEAKNSSDIPSIFDLNRIYLSTKDSKYLIFFLFIFLSFYINVIRIQILLVVITLIVLNSSTLEWIGIEKIRKIKKNEE